MRSRRGIASVVGTVFAIIALTTTITYITYSMGILNNFDQSVLVKNQQLTDVDKEKFQIASVTVPNGKLNITLANTGTLPIKFTKVWIQDSSSNDSVNSYVPAHNFVSPGEILTNMGQNMLAINPSDSYNIKIVTSRGNTQEFDMNSPSTSPLNIQMMFIPPTVTDGFQSELMMVVLNNGTSTLTNIVPTPLPSPTYGTHNTAKLSCVAGPVNPPKFDTLSPGNVAIFTWAVTATSGNAGDTCTYNLTRPLQNGYLESVSPPSPLTITAVSLSSTTYALNSGVLTMTYTSFKWIQGTTWNSDWSLPNGKTTDFQLTITNDNQTSGNYSLWLSKDSQLMLFPTTPPPNNKVVPTPYFLVSCVTQTAGPGCNGGAYCSAPPCITPYADNSTGISNEGGSVTLNFGAITAGDSSQQYYGSLQPNTEYYGTLVIYGKFTKDPSDNSGSYAQNMPFMAIISI